MKLRKPMLFMLGTIVILSSCQTVQAAQLPDVTAPVSSTFTPTFESTPTATVTSTATVMPTLALTIPAEVYITDMEVHRQTYSLSCEAAAAVDWAQYFDVFIYEYEFQTSLPISDNPDLGFVGTKDAPWGQIPPYAYGVHAEPVAALLQTYGLPAVAARDFTIEQLQAELASGQPVIAWVIGNCVSATPVVYTDLQGNQVTVAPYEHVIIMVGYGNGKVRYYNAGDLFETPIDVFARSWAVLGNMVIYFGD